MINPVINDALNVAKKEIEVRGAIKTILSDKKSYNTSLNYAVNYCLMGREMHGEALRVQCLYILSNITHWRHPEAKAVRQILKDFTKGR
jgi:hypothetical protein